MIWQRNWCERFIIVSLGAIGITSLIHLAFHSVFFNVCSILYILIIIVLSIWLTSRDIQFLLSENIPLKYDPVKGISKYSRINYLFALVPTLKKVLPIKSIKEKDDLKDKNGQQSYADISIIASVIERRCVWAWYSEYVSKEIAFPFACKELLDQMVSKVLQVSVNVDTIHLCSDSLGMLLKHCKEYRRALKRFTRIGKGSIEEYYKNTHPTSAQRDSNSLLSRGKSTQSHCLLLIRALLKELLPWELWGTPHAQLLSSILSKRLEYCVLTFLCNPKWLKYQLLKLASRNSLSDKYTSDIHSNNDKEPIELDSHTTNIAQSDKTLAVDANVLNEVVDVTNKSESNIDSNNGNAMKTSIESALSKMISNTTAPILQRAELEDTSKNIMQNIILPNIIPKNGSEPRELFIPKKSTQPIDIMNSSSSSLNENSPKLTHKKAKNSDEVKIYDRVVEGSVTTWNSDMDLTCVSLGQDLLASLDADIGFEARLGRLWEADEKDSNEAWSPHPPSTGSSTKTAHGLWFGEEDTLDMDLNEESPPKSMVQTNTSNSLSNFIIAKPLSIHNMKELQNISKNTVSQAKNKIGDLQDEAAGVMEGILDMGMAGLRKGLRLTGLQDNPQEKTQSSIVVPKTTTDSHASNLSVALGQVFSSSRKNSQSDEIRSDIRELTSTANNPKGEHDVSKSGNNSSQQNLLVKQQRVVSQDSSSQLVQKERDQQRDMIEGGVMASSLEAAGILGGDSPDYEYEEAADFASTIAKLRCLLQQKTGDVSPVSADGLTLAPQPIQDSKLSPGPNVPSQISTSPTHGAITIHQNGSTKSSKPDEVPSVPSFESDGGFTILSQSSLDLVEGEEALYIKAGGIPSANIMQGNNNMQRLDKLFTRTVTGVFNTIKTAVGGDYVSDAVSGHTEGVNGHNIIRLSHQPKDDWVFMEGDTDVSILVGRLLVERRGFCVVEAAQDSLEILGGPRVISRSSAETDTITSVQDDLDESEVMNSCPLWSMCLELVAENFGGVLQKDTMMKCASVAVADMVETLLQENLSIFNSWLIAKIIENFRELSKETLKTSIDPENENQESKVTVTTQELCDAIMDRIPALLCTLLGTEEVIKTLKILISSIEYPLINRDLVYNLIDVTAHHFLKACTSPQNNYMATPPPSA